MAFNFNGNQKNRNKSYGGSSYRDDRMDDSHYDDGYSPYDDSSSRYDDSSSRYDDSSSRYDDSSSRYSTDDSRSRGTDVTELADRYAREHSGGSSYKKYGQGRKGSKLGNINPRTLIIAGLILVGIILVIVFWDEIMSFLLSLLSMVITIGIIVVLFRMFFPGNRRRRR